MRIILPVLCLVFVLSFQSVEGQYELAKDGFSFRGVTMNYQYPVTNEINRFDFTAAFEIEYSRYIGKNFNLLFPLKLGKAKLPTDEMGGFNDSGFTSLDAMLQFQLFKESAFIVPSLHAGLGTTWEDFEDFSFQAPVGVGFDFRLTRHAYITSKVEYRVSFEDLRDNIQAGVGFKFLFGEGPVELPPIPPVTDRDGDGIADNYDACPDEPGESRFSGCPDTDGDGIADKDDECPEVAGVLAFRGCPDTDGDGVADKDDECPEEAGLPANNGCPVRDADQDGVPDDEDECPNEAGLATLNGCPDSDGDGIADKDDRCPDAPGARNAQGCPDSDGDGIADPDDRCPESVGPVTNNGCPEITEEDKQVLEFATRSIEFRTGSASLRSTSFPILDQVLDILRRYPDYNVDINGHTDSVGGEDTNQSLSERRAKSCYDYFISKGISPDRMTYTGYGELRPIATNDTATGREQNRRVEFDIFIKEQ
jgi:OOP family OmpA-OmpF porin